MAGVGEASNKSGPLPKVPTAGAGPTPTTATPTPATPGTPAPARDQAHVSDVTHGHAGPHVDIESVDLGGKTMDQKVAEITRDTASDSVVGSAVQYWHDMRKQDGVAGYVGAGMETLLEFSGLPAVDRSSAELGARVGLGDTNAHIAKAAGKLAFDSGMVLLNGMAAGGALASAGKAVKAVAAGEAVADTAATTANVVRHYTSAENALKIMKSGEIWASKTGLAGGDKVYLLAENAGPRGMNFLRQLNIGVSDASKAVEIDLAKLPPDVVASFQKEGFRGLMNGENFVTHAGKFDFNAFRDAVKVVDSEHLATTFQQVVNAGGRLVSVGESAVNVRRGAQGLAHVRE